MCYISLWKYYGLDFNLNLIYYFLFLQGVRIVFKVGLALLKYCHDDLVSISGCLSAPNHDN